VAEPPDTGAGHRRVPVRRLHAAAGACLRATAPAGGDGGDAQDWVAVEEPLEIRVAHGPAAARELFTLAVTMRTPGDDHALVAGLLFNEGVVAAAGDLASLTLADDGSPVMLAELAPSRAVASEGLARRVITGSACGVCGKTALAALAAASPWPVAAAGFAIDGQRLAALPEQLRARQPTFARTGGLHAAALFDAAGTVLDVREDVGRHNALDKLIGAALLDGRLPLAGAGILVSGRASFELLQKARMAGCPLLAAVGAPSSLAVELAWEAGISLVGFLRDGRCNVYTGAQRVVASRDGAG
jgi:FdhD protein